MTFSIDINGLWLVGQAGIVLEIVGALYILLGSLLTHRRIRRVFQGLNGLRELPRLVVTMQHQTRTDIIGFILLASGLTMQFIGGFATW